MSRIPTSQLPLVKAHLSMCFHTFLLAVCSTHRNQCEWFRLTTTERNQLIVQEKYRKQEEHSALADLLPIRTFRLLCFRVAATSEEVDTTLSIWLGTLRYPEEHTAYWLTRQKVTYVYRGSPLS